MHGVKRLFSWMIPRFDPARYNVALVSLRKKDLSEETLESMGIDISYLHKSKFDPATLTALLKVIDRQQIDILHLHGYGATTFGRLAGKMRGLPTILHEHANLTDTPWFQKIADRMLAPATDIAIAVSKSTAEFVIKARQMPPERVKVVYLGVPLEEFSRTRTLEEIAAARHELGVAPGRVPGRHRDAAARFERQLVSRRGGAASPEPAAADPVHRLRRGPACGPSSKRRRARSGSATGSPSAASRATSRASSPRSTSACSRRSGRARRSRCSRRWRWGSRSWRPTPTGSSTCSPTSTTRVIVPKRDAAALAAGMVRLIDSPEERARLAVHARVTGRQYDIAAFVRKMEQLYDLLHRVSRRDEAPAACCRRICRS